jgi:hypothetical protein
MFVDMFHIIFLFWILIIAVENFIWSQKKSGFVKSSNVLHSAVVMLATAVKPDGLFDVVQGLNNKNFHSLLT